MKTSLTIDVITDIKQAEALWNMYHTGTSLYDNWQYRLLYFQFFSFSPQFYLVSLKNEVIAMVPLQWNSDIQQLEFFGGDYMSDNTIYVKPGYESYLRDISTQISRPLRLFWTAKPYFLHAWKTCSIGYKYILPLEGFTCVEDVLEALWSKKSRKNIEHQMNELRSHDISIEENVFDDLDLLISLNKQRFGAASSFYKPYRAEFLREVIKHFDVSMMSVSIDGKKESVCYSILYNNGMYGINSGRNTKINNLGKFVILQKIARAILAGAAFYDAGRSDLGWKRAFHFQPVPLYSVTTI